MAKSAPRKQKKATTRKQMERELSLARSTIAELDANAKTLQAELDASRAVIEAKSETIATLNKFTELANKVAQLEGFTLGREAPPIAAAPPAKPARRRWW
jgi:septal ring factor EnvC (AmiA/AmiB activator)